MDEPPRGQHRGEAWCRFGVERREFGANVYRLARVDAATGQHNQGEQGGPHFFAAFFFALPGSSPFEIMSAVAFSIACRSTPRVLQSAFSSSL